MQEICKGDLNQKRLEYSFFFEDTKDEPCPYYLHNGFCPEILLAFALLNGFRTYYLLNGSHRYFTPERGHHQPPGQTASLSTPCPKKSMNSSLGETRRGYFAATVEAKLSSAINARI
jgi:hypothetical protein